MAATTDIEPLVSRLYEAALDPALWPAAWAEATAVAGRMAPSLVLVADNGGAAPMATPGWGGHAVKAVAATAAPAPSRAELAARPITTEAERATVAQLQVHLRRAVRMRARLATAQAAQAASSAALQATDTGVVLVTAGARMVYADQAAQRLAASVGLQLDSRRGALQALEPAATQLLHSLVHDAAAGGVGGDMLMRASDGTAVAVAVSGLTCSLPSAEAEEGEDWSGKDPGYVPGQALVTLRHLGQVPACQRRVAALFGLTRAEADVAVAVAGGQGVAEIAAGRGVSPGTVQGQVRSALNKAGVPGVQELGLLFARLA